jgi:hypothetical protein
MRRVRLSAPPPLLKVGESGAFRRGVLGKSNKSCRMQTDSRVVANIRQMLIDDVGPVIRLQAREGDVGDRPRHA